MRDIRKELLERYTRGVTDSIRVAHPVLRYRRCTGREISNLRDRVYYLLQETLFPKPWDDPSFERSMDRDSPARLIDWMTEKALGVRDSALEWNSEEALRGMKWALSPGNLRRSSSGSGVTALPKGQQLRLVTD